MSTNILNRIDLNKNDSFILMAKEDLDSVLNQIDCFDLFLRSNINMSKNDTFGFEIEFESKDIYEINIELDKYFRDNWKLENDGTIPYGGEIITPILYDSFSTWFEISDVCEILKKYATIGESCGGHIHIGNQMIEDECYFINFIKVWLAFEDVIFRFSFGEYLYYRENILRYAMPLAKNILKNKKKLDLNLLLRMVNYTSMDAIHLKGKKFDMFNVDNTIEFRCPNGTLNPIIWQNNLNLFINLLNYSKNKYNDMLIKYIISNNMKKYNEYDISDYELMNMYSKIDIDKAFLLCDAIFDNNLDKLYFLKQYFKDFEETKIYKKSKKFTK